MAITVTKEDEKILLLGLDALIANGNVGVAETDLYKKLAGIPAEKKKAAPKKKEEALE